jgi:DinB family protein
MKDLLRLLQAERRMERDFVGEATRLPEHPTGWPTALLLFHVYRWRERLRNGLRQLRDGQAVTPPPENVDELNDRELQQGRGVSLRDAAERADATLAELIELYRAVGEKRLKWYIAETTGEALVRHSYFHPRNHIGEHFIERGDRQRGRLIFEETVADLRAAEAPHHTLGPALVNLANVRIGDGQVDVALRLLGEGLPMRPDLRTAVANDPEFAPLKGDSRFQALIKA